MLRLALLVAKKDVLVEWRSREVLYTTGLFAALLVVVFSFAFPRAAEAVRGAAPGMLWVAVAFAGTIALGRMFDREREHDTMRALLLAPAPRLALFAGKAIAVFALVLVVAVLVVLLLGLLLSVDWWRAPGPLVCVLLLGTFGFAIVGTVFAAGLLRSRSRDVLLPIVLYPILMPLFIAGTRATAALLLPTPNLDTAWYWITFLGMYDAAFLVAALWTFEALVIE